MRDVPLFRDEDIFRPEAGEEATMFARWLGTVSVTSENRGYTQDLQFGASKQAVNCCTGMPKSFTFCWVVVVPARVVHLLFLTLKLKKHNNFELIVTDAKSTIVGFVAVLSSTLDLQTALTLILMYLTFFWMLFFLVDLCFL